tara:strand:- start:3439 stop:3642 length:204 start_codon:yes stop_codon:yes gene_type:complete
MSLYAEFKAVFKLPSPLTVATQQLAAAELLLLKAEMAAEYALATVAYTRAQTKRLSAYIEERSKEPQ